MRRREFLKGMAAGGAALAGGLYRGRVRAAGATAWGAYPEYAQAALLPPEAQAKNVLEVFLYGGLCPWETFYVVPEFGRPDNPIPALRDTQWWTFQEGPNNVREVYRDCVGASAPPMLKEFRTDSAGQLVHLGPFSEPLRSRTDIVDRLRVHVVNHTLEPHEGAIPYAASGYRLGSPKLAGLGAAVQHYHQARAPIITGEPYAYVLFSPADFPTDNLRSAGAVGQHPGSARPLAIRVEDNTSFIDALARGTLGTSRQAFDDLVDLYTSRYQKRLVPPGFDRPVRSQTWADFDFSLRTLQQTGVLVDILEPELFTGVAGGSCGQSADVNYPHMGLRLGAQLLTRPDGLARYVCVFDGGLIPASGGGGYDTHNSHVIDSARNLTNLWTQLAAVINEPGEDDPTKLDLDDTLVVINTEFGRTPGPQNGDGRNHWPYAYVTLMFGGPIGPEQQGIVGAIGPAGQATESMGPAATRAAVLAALGIFPFAPECYAVSDVDNTFSELEAAMWLNEVVLGRTA